MGYESRLYVVNKTDMETSVIEGDVERRMKWGELLATFNMCVLGNECYPLWSGNETDCAFYDGHEYPIRDKYDKPLTENTVKDTIAVLEEAERATHYRRHQQVIAFLKAIDESEWDNVVVLHYGY